MNLTSFNPLILTSKSEEVISLFEALGFEKIHCHDTGLNDIKNYTLANKDDFRVDVAQTSIQQDKIIIRMNVDNFDEAYEMLTSKGFKQSGKEVDTKFAKSCLMVSSSGYAFDLCHHIKEHE